LFIYLLTYIQGDIKLSLSHGCRNG